MLASLLQTAESLRSSGLAPAAISTLRPLLASCTEDIARKSRAADELDEEGEDFEERLHELSTDLEELAKVRAVAAYQLSLLLLQLADPPAVSEAHSLLCRLGFRLSLRARALSFDLGHFSSPRAPP
ncbi:hypothetical protein TeGR_g4630, partial [Tetraparma gracilis]